MKKSFLIAAEIIFWVVSIAGLILGVIFSFYLLIGFLNWISSDPLDLIDIGPENQYTEGERKWDDCAQSARIIYDNFNDTVGATYALEDTPSNDVQEFMKLCLEKNI